MKITRNLFTISFIFCVTLLFAQEKPVETPTPTIDQQFDELIQESNNYKQYEVVQKSRLVTLQNNTQTIIDGLKKEISSSNNHIKELQKEIDKINTTLAKTTKKLEETNKSKQEIAFLGLPTNKTTYKVIMWGIVLILLVGLILFIYKFKNSHVVTNEAEKDLQDIREEFDEYRKSALEKQQKMGRMLQDERNKLQRHTENRPS